MTTTPNTTASGAADLMRNALRETAAVLVLEDAFPDLLQMVESALAASAPVAPAPITDAEQAAWFAGLDEGRSQARGAAQAAPAPVIALLDRIADLEAQLESIGAGGVHGPLIGCASPPTAQAEGWTKP